MTATTEYLILKICLPKYFKVVAVTNIKRIVNTVQQCAGKCLSICIELNLTNLTSKMLSV